jgi:predicted nucleic acid-binding protein
MRAIPSTLRGVEGKRMKFKAFVVLDADVLVAAAKSGVGAPCEIFKLIENGNLIPVYDDRLLEEYRKAAGGDEAKESGRLVSDKVFKEKISAITENGMRVKNIAVVRDELSEAMSGRDDIPFFEVRESACENESLPTENDKYLVNSKVLLVTMERLDGHVHWDCGTFESLRKIFEKSC